MARRMLLTSSGVPVEALQEALTGLLGGPTADAHVVVLPTAALAEPGDSGWFVEHLVRIRDLGWRTFDLLEPSGLPPALVRQRLRAADVIWVEGGNHYHLARSLVANGLVEELRAALERQVYVGVSAGSMIFSRHLTTASAEVFGDLADLQVLGADAIEPPFGLFDWYLKPHLGGAHHPERTDAWADGIAARAGFPVCFLDDATAVRVRGAEIDVVSAGRWRSTLGAPGAPGGGPANG